MPASVRIAEEEVNRFGELLKPEAGVRGGRRRAHCLPPSFLAAGAFLSSSGSAFLSSSSLAAPGLGVVVVLLFGRSYLDLGAIVQAIAVAGDNCIAGAEAVEDLRFCLALDAGQHGLLF